jgi:hypothetical protein
MGATLSSISFTLTDGGGNNVDCLPLTPATDSSLTNGAMCVPYAPLQANARYTVHVTGVLTSFSASTRANQAHPVDLTWSFTTAQVAAMRAMLNNPPPRQLPRF